MQMRREGEQPGEPSNQLVPAPKVLDEMVRSPKVLHEMVQTPGPSGSRPLAVKPVLVRAALVTPLLMVPVWVWVPVPHTGSCRPSHSSWPVVAG